MSSIYDDLAEEVAGVYREKVSERGKADEQELTELRAKVSRLEKQLKAVNDQKSTLEKNISCLYSTAKEEVQRKDKLILELRKSIIELKQQSQHPQPSTRASTAPPPAPPPRNSSERGGSHSQTRLRTDREPSGNRGKRDDGLRNTRRPHSPRSGRSERAYSPRRDQHLRRPSEHRSRSHTRSRSPRRRERTSRSPRRREPPPHQAHSSSQRPHLHPREVPFVDPRIAAGYYPPQMMPGSSAHPYAQAYHRYPGSFRPQY